MIGGGADAGGRTGMGGGVLATVWRGAGGTTGAAGTEGAAREVTTCA